MAENTVNASEEVIEPANVFSFGPEDNGSEQFPVDGGEEVLEPDEDNYQDSTNETGEDDGDADRFDGMSQKDIGKAFAAERKRTAAKARSEVENSGIYKLGQRMVEDIMEQKNVGRDEAIKMANDNFLRAVADREGISPSIARRLYGQAIEQATETPEDSAERFTDELMNMNLPKGFNLEEASTDPEFAELLMELGTKAAVRVYAAENSAKNAKQDIAEKIQSRNNVPQMTRTARSVSPRTDWSTVSREEFLAEKARRQKYL